MKSITYLTHSAGIKSKPGAFLFFSLDTALVTSSTVMMSLRIFSIGSLIVQILLSLSKFSNISIAHVENGLDALDVESLNNAREVEGACLEGKTTIDLLTLYNDQYFNVLYRYI